MLISEVQASPFVNKGEFLKNILAGYKPRVMLCAPVCTYMIIHNCIRLIKHKIKYRKMVKILVVLNCFSIHKPVLHLFISMSKHNSY